MNSPFCDAQNISDTVVMPPVSGESSQRQKRLHVAGKAHALECPSSVRRVTCARVAILEPSSAGRLGRRLRAKVWARPEDSARLGVAPSAASSAPPLSEVDPLRIAFNWIFYGFCGYLEIDQASSRVLVDRPRSYGQFLFDIFLFLVAF